MKTSTLTGADLNRAVAMALGHELTFFIPPDDHNHGVPGAEGCAMTAEGRLITIPDYACDITAAWPIIVEHKIALTPHDLNNGNWNAAIPWTDAKWRERWAQCMYNAPPLIAAMRCFVASVLGDEVEL